MDIKSSVQIGSLTLPHRLIQGPLAGFTCAPYRAQFAAFQQPAYCVSEMISAHDLLYRQPPRFVSRDPAEALLAYQLCGHDPDIMARAAEILAAMGADLIDINCGCPKTKIRKKGSGSALLANPERLIQIITAIKARIRIPVTVKIRSQERAQDVALAVAIEQAGADGLIVDGRRWQDDYAQPCNQQSIAEIKRAVTIPVIANGDISDHVSLQTMIRETECDAYMISRAGTGRPWLYAALLDPDAKVAEQWQYRHAVDYFMQHLRGLAQLQNEYLALLQSKTLARYYFRPWFAREHLQIYYQLDSFPQIEQYLRTFTPSES